MNLEYNVENDEYYQKHVSKPSINEITAIKYKKTLTKFCRATNKTLGEIITSCIDEQNVVTTIELDPDKHGNKRRREIRFDINSKDALINKYIEQFITYCKNRKNKNVTINRELGDIKAFLKGNGVILPKIEPLEDDSAEWNLLTKEDFNYILQDSTIVHQSLANFLIGTGMRIGDATSLCIGDFMDATSDYHDFVDVEDFIDNAPEDMIGTWVFTPHKTKKDKIKCITFNTSHASNLILQNLRRIKNQYLPYKNKKDGTNLKISKKDALFGSRTSAYKKPITSKSVADQWYKKNEKFKAWKISLIKQQIANGELSEEDYDEAVDKIPKFHPHICRKFFTTTVGNNCGDIRVCALLEGHSGGLATDKSYIKKSVEDIKDIYINNIHDELCLSKVETKIVSDKETERLNAEIESLKAENAKIREEKDQEITNLEQKHQDEINEIKSSVGNMEKRVDEKLEAFNKSTSRKTKNDIEYVINTYCKENLDETDKHKAYVIRRFALDIALENKSEFTDNNDYLTALIKKAQIEMILTKKSTDELFKELMSRDNAEYANNKELIDAIDQIMKAMTSNEELMTIIGDDDFFEIQDAIAKHLTTSQYDLTNLSDDDIDSMIHTALMDYISI